MVTPDDIKQMQNRFRANRKAYTGDQIECAYCGKSIIKTMHTVQFCTNINERNCKNLYHRVVRQGKEPDEKRTGQTPKLDPIKHRSAILKDLKAMTRKAVANKYGVGVHCLYNTLLRWGCYNALANARSVTERKLTAADDALIEEMYKTMSMKDIAAKMDVSRATIQRSLTGSESRDRMISELGFDVKGIQSIGEELDSRKSVTVTVNQTPTYILVPIDDYLKIVGK